MKLGLTMLMIGALALGGCDLEPPPGNAVPDAGAAMEQSTKLDSYDGVLPHDDNFSFDPVNTFRRYEAYDIPRAKPEVEVSLYPSGLRRIVADLRQVRAMPGSVPQVDAAVDRALPVLDRLLARMQGLDSYYVTRGPLADQLARGRAEHPLLVADFKAAIAAWEPLLAAYDAARDAALARSADFYRREKRMVEYYDVRIVQQATALAKTIDTPAAARDPERVKAAEAIVADLLALIERDRAARTGQAERAERARSPDVALVDLASEMVIDNSVPQDAEQMIGAWRDLRHTPDDKHHAALREAYARLRSMRALL